MRRSRVKLIGLLGLACGIGFGIACSATRGNNIFDEDDGAGGGQAGAGGTVADGGGGGLFLDGGPTGTGVGGSTPCANQDPNQDQDGDGFFPPMDCNDCDPNVNPNALEVPTPMVGMDGGPPPAAADEDCNGMVDDVAGPCDQGLLVDSQTPEDAARAIELCKFSSGPNDWGVTQAKWVLPDGSPPPAAQMASFHLGHGMLGAFGPNVAVRAGSKMFAVSSGTARQPTDPGYQSVGGFDKLYTANHPQGFPKESPACPGVFTGIPHDATAVELTIRVPSNAFGFSFDFDFYTYEWPNYVCSTYNDFFVAILSPIPVGQTDGNISFDMQGNPISVNNAFMDVCGCSAGPPCSAGGKTFPCALGNTELVGTGFGIDAGFQDHAATSWLVTSAPVAPNEVIIMRFGVYDSGDGVLDSTTLVDNWAWIAQPGTTVGTKPVDPPE